MVNHRAISRAKHIFNSRPGISGFTLIESVISISIMLLVTGMAFGTLSFIRDYETVSDINDLIADLYYSRTEALKRHSTITLCRSNDGATCIRTNDWENGWMIFTDNNRNRVVDEKDEIIRTSNGLDHVGSLTLGSGYYYYIMFSSTGAAYPRNTFKVCRPGTQPRAIILYASGRARVSRLDSSGIPLKCA